MPLVQGWCDGFHYLIVDTLEQQVHLLYSCVSIHYCFPRSSSEGVVTLNTNRLMILREVAERGTITAACDAPVFQGVVEKEVLVESVLTNEAGEVVARGRAVWLAGPVKE